MWSSLTCILTCSVCSVAPWCPALWPDRQWPTRPLSLGFPWNQLPFPPPCKKRTFAHTGRHWGHIYKQGADRVGTQQKDCHLQVGERGLQRPNSLAWCPWALDVRTAVFCGGSPRVHHPEALASISPFSLILTQTLQIITVSVCPCKCVFTSSWRISLLLFPHQLYHKPKFNHYMPNTELVVLANVQHSQNILIFQSF